MQHSAAVLRREPPPTGPSPDLAPDRDELVRQGLPLVKAIAERLRRRYTLSATFDDLCAMGMTGLAIAIDRFDPSRGASFVTFAYHKVRGAILDGLRRSDRRYSFEMRCHVAAERRAAEQLAFDDGLLSCGSESRIETVADDIAASMTQVATLHLAAVSGADDEHTPLEPDEAVHQREVRERVQLAIARLPEREREVISLYYYGDGSLADVAAQLGISRAWVSRLLKRALAALRNPLAELGEDLPDSVAPLTEAAVDAPTVTAVETPERASVPRLELDLVRPPRGDIGAPALQLRHRCEQLDLGGQFLASPIATVGQDDLQSAGVGEKMCEPSLPLSVQAAPGSDVARLLPAVPHLVSDGVDGTLDEDQLAITGSVAASGEGARGRLRDEARDVVGAAQGTEAPGIERSSVEAQLLQHPTRVAAAGESVVVSDLGSSQISRLFPQVPAVVDSGADVAAAVVGTRDEELERVSLVEPLVPLEERHERASVGRRSRVRVRPGASVRVLPQPEDVAIRRRHREVVAIRFGDRRGEAPARQEGRQVDRLLEPFQQRVIYFHVASRVRPRRGGGVCCLGLTRTRASPRGTPRSARSVASFPIVGREVAR
jgi:RNA polymerase sigma factor for flagellar operon FliA